MKEIRLIKTPNCLLLIVGLVLLLLLSPCSLRNFVQTEVGVPITEVVNKSQTTLAQTNCTKLQVGEITLLPSFSKDFVVLKDFKAKTSSLIPIDIPLKSISFYVEQVEPLIFVPRYILYKKLQVYLEPLQS